MVRSKRTPGTLSSQDREAPRGRRFAKSHVRSGEPSGRSGDTSSSEDYESSPTRKRRRSVPIQEPKGSGIRARKLRGLVLNQSRQASHDDVFSVAAKLYSGIGTPVALELLSSLKKGDWRAIANASIKHEDYHDVNNFFVDYCAVNFLRKYDDLRSLGDEPDDRESKVIDLFFQSERDCLETNERLTLYTEGLFSPMPHVRRILERARVLIKQLLGPCPNFSQLSVRFGPGATSACTGDRTTIADKLVAFPTCTLDAVPLVAELRSVSEVWFNLIHRLHPSTVYGGYTVVDDFGNEIYLSGYIAPKVVRGNRLTCVPKDALKFRGICPEPDLNVCFQLAIGQEMRKACHRAGLVLDVQQQVNRRYAALASEFGEYATVDLSAASDTVSYELVKYLLPWNWFLLLARFRSPETNVKGKWIELEKFSSMGNGYTFELETLLFYALTRGTADEMGLVKSAVNVYGDDIIVHGDCLSTLKDLFSFCGFTINTSKTFWKTRFNESCGGDFLDGADVRPYFLKDSPQNASDWYVVANGIRHMAVKHSLDGGLDPRFVRAWIRAIAHIPKALRFQGPEGYGDGYLHTDDRSRWTCRTRFSIYQQKCLISRNRIRSPDRYCGETIYAAALYGCDSSGFPLRGDPERFVTRWLPDAELTHKVNNTLVS